MDQGKAIQAYQIATSREREARGAQVRAEAALGDAKEAHRVAARAKEDAWGQLDLTLCGQDQADLAQQMAAQIDRAFVTVATSVGAAQLR